MPIRPQNAISVVAVAARRVQFPDLDSDVRYGSGADFVEAVRLNIAGVSFHGRTAHPSWPHVISDLTNILEKTKLVSMNLDELLSNAERVEGFLKAMANRHRLMILCELHRGECSVTALNQRLYLSQSALSQHLARLREDNLVETRRESQTIYYSLADKNVERIIGLLWEIFCKTDRGSDDEDNPKRQSIEP